jgi:uncharacterized membrane protein
MLYDHAGEVQLMDAALPVSVRRPVLYPNLYAWYILVSAMDIMITVTLLIHLGAHEVNMIAQRSIELFGTWGLIGLKFASVILVVAICEYIGRRRPRTGRGLAIAAIFISLFPIVAATAQVLFVLTMGHLEWTDWPPLEATILDESQIPPGLL